MDNYAYSGSGTGGAFYSNNNGINWDSVSFQYTVRVYAMKYIPAVPGMALAGTEDVSSHIYISLNNSHIFSPYSEGLGANATPRSLASNDTYTFYGTDYTGVWRRFLPGVTPVELTSFTATSEGSNVRLNWQTASETNNSGFEIQRKTDNLLPGGEQKGWVDIGFVEGNRTTTEESNYTYFDKEIKSGSYDYRLKQVDLDGSFEYSEIVSVEISSPTEFSLSQNYPNPFNPATIIQYSIPSAGNIKLTVFNSLGEKIAVLVDEYKKAGNYKISFDAHSFTSGIYFYRLQANNSTKIYLQTKKMCFIK